MLYLRQLAIGLSPRRPESVHVGFFVDKVTLGHIFLWVLQFSAVSIIPPVLHTHISSGGGGGGGWTNGLVGAVKGHKIPPKN
jgi:hypothetical protein